MKNFALIPLLIAGCAELPPVHTTLSMQSLKAPPQATAQDVTIGVDPITYESWKEHIDLHTKISWQETDRNAPMGMGDRPGSNTARVTRSAEVSLVPLPAMRVTIHNSSSHALKLDHAKLELGDGRHQWAAMTSTGEVQGRAEGDIIGAYPAINDNHSVLDGLSGVIGQLPLLTPSLSVAAGASWEGFVCFKVEVHDADEFNDLMQADDKLTFVVAGVELDGKALPPFTFVLPKETLPKQVTCPGEEKKPSVKKCKEG